MRIMNELINFVGGLCESQLKTLMFALQGSYIIVFITFISKWNLR